MYGVLSPDGFSISMTETWETREEAESALKEWIKRYEKQGYYSTSNRTRIPLGELYDACTILPLND
jgi:hypothetical protein